MSDLKTFWDFYTEEPKTIVDLDEIRTRQGMFFWLRGGKQFVLKYSDDRSLKYNIDLMLKYQKYLVMFLLN